jgi:hypothetical protein
VDEEALKNDVKAEGTDAVLLLISSSAGPEFELQEKFVKDFIDCKSRFKKMRNRSVRFYVTDINTQVGLDLGIKQDNVPAMVVYPAFHKKTLAALYSGEVDGVEMAKFIHKKADIKFELKEQFFTPAKDPNEGLVMMEMDA